MTTQARLLTAEDLLALPDDGQRHELVRGELHQMPPPGDEHGEIAGELYGWLWQHVKQYKLGKVYAAETGYLIARNPDTVRGADVSFVRRERLTPRQKTYRAIAPDLVAEVVSPSDSYLEVEEKVREWLAAGTRMVLVVNPRHQTLTVHQPMLGRVELELGDVLDGGDVVPGWTLPVRVLFEED